MTKFEIGKSEEFDDQKQLLLQQLRTLKEISEQKPQKDDFLN